MDRGAWWATYSPWGPKESDMTEWKTISLSLFKSCMFSSCCSVAQSCPTLCNPMDCSTSGFPVLHHLPEPCSNSWPLSWWCHPAILSSIMPFSSCLQSFPASGSFLMSGLFTSGGQSSGASASVLPMNIQAWFSLVLTGWIPLKAKGLSRVFSNTTVQKQQLSGSQLSL